MTLRPTPWFLRQVKNLSKKYPSITDDIRKLTLSLEENPTQGTKLKKGCFKIRMAISSKSKDKKAEEVELLHVYVFSRIQYIF